MLQLSIVIIKEDRGVYNMHFKINRKTIIIFFICFVFLCSIFINERVNAASAIISAGELPTGSSTASNSCYGCSGGLPSATGLAYGYRVSVVDSSGKLYPGSHSYEYWSSGGGLGTINNGYKFVENPNNYPSTGIKQLLFYQDILPKTLDKSAIKNCTASDSCKYNSEYKEEDKLVQKSGYNLVEPKTVSCDNFYSRIAIVPGGTNGQYAQCRAHNFTRFAKVELEKRVKNIQNGVDEEESLEAFIKFLKDCNIKGANDQQLLVNVKDYYLLVEPVGAIEKSGKTYIGSVNDLYKLGFYWPISNYLYELWPYYNPTVYTEKSLGPIKACDNPLDFDNRGNNLGGKYGCLGVFVIQLSDIIITPPCSSVASSYWKSINKGEIKVPGQSKATLFKNTIIGKLKNDGAYSDDYAWLAKFDKYGYTWDSLGDLLSTTCDFNCNAAVRNIFNTSSEEKKDIKNMIKTNSKYSELRKKMTGGNTYYYELYGEGINVDGKNLCAPVTCNEALLGTMSTFVPSIGKRVNNSVELTASQFTSEGQRSVLQGLYNIFNDKDFLNPDNVFSFRYIACKEIDSCYPEMEVDARCVSNGKTFTLYDSNKIDKCIKSGIAYNNKRANGTIAGSGNINESSVDTIDGNGKCREKVSFTFPGDETGIKAGTVFTWGTGRSITGQPKTEIFGTMTVERTCYLNGKSSISMKWADNNINPKIALYYKEAIPNSVTSYTSKKINGTNLNVENIIKEINVYSDESGTQRIGGNNSGKVVKCGGNCNNAKRVDMKASYDIKYGTSFLWHYNRNINDTSLTLEKSDSENNYYTAIGYGLPTSFVTPTGMKGNYEFGSTVTSNDSNGYMYVKVNNVGTCKNSASNECHFNKSLTFAVTDDNAADKTSIYYKCKFDIENELFGTEDGDDANPNDPPKGLDVVFRTVQLINKNVSDSEKEAELNKAFPGRSGNGRYTSRDKNNNRIVGSNWLKIEKNEADNTKRIFEILSNMVYAQEPAYHIVLDTTKINYIRRNNVTYRNVDFDPYTSNQRYKFDKTGANIYAYGASDFITELINTNWLDGVCASGDTDARAKRGACRQS